MSRNRERLLTYLAFFLFYAVGAYASVLTNPLCYFVSNGVYSIVTLTNPLPVVSN